LRRRSGCRRLAPEGRQQEDDETRGNNHEALHFYEKAAEHEGAADDVVLLRRIRNCLYDQGYTIKGVQKLLREGALKNDDPPRAPPPNAATPRVVKSENLRAELLQIRGELVALRDLLKKAQRS